MGDNSSEVYVFDHSNGQLDTYTGTTEIQSLFEALFSSLPDPDDVGAPVQIVEEKETAPYVLLVWKSPGNGYARATDTFVFNNADTAMIKRPLKFRPWSAETQRVAQKALALRPTKA